MYYIIEHQIRPDGIVNVSETGRTTLAVALAYYYERMSKMVVNEAFVSVHFLLVDEKLAIIKNDNVETLYTPPTPEPEVTE